MTKNTQKSCLWCGNNVMTTENDLFPRHSICSSEMNDKGLMPTYYTANGEGHLAIFHRPTKLRVELKSGEIGRKIWKVYENTEHYNIRNPKTTVRGFAGKEEESGELFCGI